MFDYSCTTTIGNTTGVNSLVAQIPAAPFFRIQKWFITGRRHALSVFNLLTAQNALMTQRLVFAC